MTNNYIYNEFQIININSLKAVGVFECAKCKIQVYIFSRILCYRFLCFSTWVYLVSNQKNQKKTLKLWLIIAVQWLEEND